MLWLILLLFLSVDAERFDTSGMPPQPTSFVEQQIFEMIRTHKPGDLADAARVQRKLGRYYADQGDERRAKAAFERASAIDGPQQPVPPPVLREQPASSAGDFSGNYYGYSGRTLNTWEFHPDGTFLHTWIASGAGTSVRNSERGAFRITGDTMELRMTSTASAFVTPGSGGSTTLAGGGAGAAAEVRRLKFERQNSGITLDGQTLKPKSW